MAELPKLYIDNPGGDWLQRKLEQAQEDYQTAPIGSTRKNIGSSNVTGYFKTNLDLSPDLLKDLPGVLGEEDFRGSSVKLELLEKSIREQGYDPSPILVNVREDGQPFIVEGNHRVVEALKSGRTSIPVELKYLRGAEDAEGPLSMDRLREFYGTVPKDQSNLPAVLDAASVASELVRTQADDPRLKGKGRVMRGIGSLMRGRNVFSLIQALREGYELLPEEYQVLDEALQYLKGTEFNPFGMDKPGIESLKEWLGISPEDLGETIPLPKVQKIDTALEDISVDPVQGTAPEKTVKAYKLFRTDSRFPGELFPLFVESKSPINIGSWVDSALVEQTTAGKIKSKLGPLAFRPGWHGSEFPVATHIGSKSSPLLNKPDIRPDNQVWAEVEFPNDVDWQTEAINRASIVKSGPRKGEINLREAHITDQIPTGGFYRYKTNPNMQNDWLISGSMKINRVLNDADVEKINSAAGLADLPRARFVHKTRPDTEKAAGGFIDKPLYDDQRMIG
jgi:hypothetical protein